MRGWDIWWIISSRNFSFLKFMQKDKIFMCDSTPDNQMFQYFITVVPTRLNTYKISADTHQFSVTERVSQKKNVTPFVINEKGLKRMMVFRQHHTVCFLGTGDKPRSRKSRSFWHLREVWHQLPDGDGQWAAYAPVAVPGPPVWHRWGYILHDRQAQVYFNQQLCF